MSEYVVGVDIGTSSTKGVLVQPDGTIVATAVVAHVVSTPRPGWFEMDARSIWADDLAQVCRQLMSSTGPRDNVLGVGVSGIGPSLLACNERVEPLRPAILYGIDMRASDEIDELTTRFGEEAIVERCGAPLTSQAVGPKMLWLQHHDPEIWARARRWYSSNSFAVAWLTGEYVLDHHTASQCLPLYDINRGEWCGDWYEQIALDLERPRLVWPGEVVGVVTADASTATGLPPGTPVVAGTVDAWAEAWSAGVRHPGDVMVMYGSTMFIVQSTVGLERRPKLWSTVGIEPGSFSLAAGMSTSGSLTEWFQRQTGGIPFRDLVAEAETTPPGAGGLLVLPYFAGERTPIFDKDARGVMVGLTLSHSRGHMLRALYEGIGFGIRQILELLASSPTYLSLTAVGGGTHSSLWLQVVSDITGCAQRVPAATIGASYGDALLAAIGTGLVPSSTDWARTGTVVEPVPERRPLYDELYDLYQGLYPATKDAMHRTAAIQASAMADVAR